MTSHTSSVALLIAAAAFYASILVLLKIAHRSWMDILAIGGVVTILCFTVDVLFPPIGLVIFACFHAVWIFIWIWSATRRKSKT